MERIESLHSSAVFFPQRNCDVSPFFFTTFQNAIGVIATTEFITETETQWRPSFGVAATATTNCSSNRKSETKKKTTTTAKKNKGGTKEEEDAEKEILDNGTHDNEKKNEHEKNMGGGFKKWRNFFLYFGAASAS